jgi:PAS domain S-box-containing protein
MERVGYSRNLMGTAGKDELADSRAWFAALVESSNDAIVGVTIDGRIVSWNSGAEQMYGWPASEAIGKHVLETVIPAERAHETTAILLHVGEGSRLDSFETERRRRDGTRIPVAVTASPVRDANGRIIGASTIARDISKRLAAEQGLRESEQWARDLIANAPDAVIGMDESGAITEWNGVAEEVFGWTAVEALGRPLESLIVPVADQEAHRAGLALYLLRDDGPMVGGRTCTHARRRDDSVFPVELTILVHRVGGLRRFTAFVRDQSYQYETEVKLRRLAAVVEGSHDRPGD